MMNVVSEINGLPLVRDVLRCRTRFQVESLYESWLSIKLSALNRHRYLFALIRVIRG
jgi:hypothetical protein